MMSAVYDYLHPSAVAHFHISPDFSLFCCCKFLLRFFILISSFSFVLNLETANDWRRLLWPGRQHSTGWWRARHRATRRHDEWSFADSRCSHIYWRLYRRLPRHLEGTLEKGKFETQKIKQKHTRYAAAAVSK